ncbi:hypothetical protein [uncultured Gimesia sp.]|uniref:hypothetical protein n=1 Tax=uncultured Gimesia sp. TaxID=1678688 RepID=UPI002628C7F5|nr:hypothetical protein [uncultured Gimesia sp.]
MKKMSFSLAVVALFLCLSTDNLRSAIDAEKPQAEPDSEVTVLLERIASLEKRVAELEKKRLALPTQPFVFHELKDLNSFIPVAPVQPTHPQNWKRKQINGMDYFIVPLNSTGKMGPTNGR